MLVIVSHLAVLPTETLVPNTPAGGLSLILLSALLKRLPSNNKAVLVGWQVQKFVLELRRNTLDKVVLDPDVNFLNKLVLGRW